jgi:hypothetical protein
MPDGHNTCIEHIVQLPGAFYFHRRCITNPWRAPLELDRDFFPNSSYITLRQNKNEYPTSRIWRRHWAEAMLGRLSQIRAEPLVLPDVGKVGVSEQTFMGASLLVLGHARQSRLRSC